MAIHLPENTRRLCLLGAACALLLAGAGCLSTSGKSGDGVVELRRSDAPPKPVQAASPVIGIPAPTPGATGRPAGILWPSRGLKAGATTAETRPYSMVADMVKEMVDPEQKAKLNLNLDAPDEIANIIKMFATILDFQYWLDPGVSGTVALALGNREFSGAELWQLLEDILWMQGAYMTRRDGFIQILPFAKMPQEKRLFVKHEPRVNVEAAIVRLKHTDAAAVNQVLQPYITPGAATSPVPHLNGLLIVEAPDNMPKLRELIRQLDVLGESQWPMISRQCRRVEAVTVLEELRRIMPTIGFPLAADGQVGGAGIKIIALERLQVLVFSAPTVGILTEIDRWIALLDRDEDTDQERIYFYDVKYNKAEDLNEAIGTFFNVSGSSASRPRSTSSSASSTSSTATSARTPGGSTASPAPKPRPRRSTPAAATEPGAGIFDVPVSVHADLKHNRLVIRTTPPAYTMLEALLRRLDSPPLQVVVQMSIAEIQLNQETQYGFKYAARGSSSSDKYGLHWGLDPTGDGTAARPGFSLLFQNNASPEDIFSFVEAVAGKGNTKILFSPQIIAISDEEAVINVGDSVPIVTSETNAGDSANITRSIQFRDTGIILTVKPHITANRMVTLDIKQEVSDAVQTTSSNIESPTIQTRVLQSSLIVADGSTVLLGGLISSRNVKNDSGFPILMDIPILGNFFSFKKNSERRQELLLLITVNVIELDSDLDRIIKRYRKAVAAIQDEIDPK